MIGIVTLGLVVGLVYVLRKRLGGRRSLDFVVSLTALGWGLDWRLDLIYEPSDLTNYVVVYAGASWFGPPNIVIPAWLISTGLVGMIAAVLRIEALRVASKISEATFMAGCVIGMSYHHTAWYPGTAIYSGFYGICLLSVVDVFYNRDR